MIHVFEKSAQQLKQRIVTFLSCMYFKKNV